jgi:hypothetical protein
MYVRKQDGLRTVTITEEEYDIITHAFDLLKKRARYETPELSIELADEILVLALEHMALDDSDLLDEFGEFDPTKVPTE